jgi:hypothetical protein
MIVRDPGRMPTEEQDLMLRAALLEGPEGREAALTWLPTANIDRIGKAARRLLPLLHERLRAEGIDHPIMSILKGVRRHTWYNNRMLFHLTGDVVRSFKRAGIKVAIIKGVALTTAYYRDYTMRPMDDADLLVPVKDAVSAIQILKNEGWRCEFSAGPNFAWDRILNYTHALHFFHPSGRDLDLHWHLLAECLGPDADLEFWNGARQTTFEEQEVRVLNDADNLLHTLAHGFAWCALSPIRWIPDAITILRKSPDLDWERFIEQARERQLTSIVRESLSYVHERFRADIPAEVLSEFGKTRPRLLERLEYRTYRSAASVSRSLLFGPIRATRISRTLPLRSKFLVFPRLLCVQWHVEHQRALPAVFWRRLLQLGRRAVQAHTTR